MTNVERILQVAKSNARLQKQGEFKKLVVTQRKFADGIRRLYVINPSEEETKADST